MQEQLAKSTERQFSNKSVWEKLSKNTWKVDKAKWKFILKQQAQTQDIANKLGLDSRVNQSWESKDIRSCRYNYTIECKEGNVYVGIESNNLKASNDEIKKTVIVEYNPQKVNIKKEIPYLKKLWEIDMHRISLASVDMAFDMEIDITDIKVNKRRKNEYWNDIGHEQLETMYRRKQGQNGAVKIYNKVLEMNGGNNEDIEKETGEIKKLKWEGICTRYEIRIKPEKELQSHILLNPFLVESITELHELEIKNKTNEEKILEEINRIKSKSERKNLEMLLRNMEQYIDINKRKKYKELYKDIKKRVAPTTQNKIIPEEFNKKSLAKSLFTYTENIILEKNSQVLISELSPN